MSDQLLCNVSPQGVATLTLNRPQVHNAFDDALILKLIHALADLKNNPSVRLLILRAEGKSFSAGADLKWMQKMGTYSHGENVKDAEKLGQLMEALDTFPSPTISVIQGNAFGGALGLIAAADIAVAVDHARFSLSEVKLGLLPAVISPYVLRAIGERQSRRYMLTGELFSAADACRMGLVHQVVASDKLQPAVDDFVAALLKGGPAAQTNIKALLFCLRAADSQNVLSITAEKIASARVSEEGQKGMAAFFAKQTPEW